MKDLMGKPGLTYVKKRCLLILIFYYRSYTLPNSLVKILFFPFLTNICLPFCVCPCGMPWCVYLHIPCMVCLWQVYNLYQWKPKVKEKEWHRIFPSNSNQYYCCFTDTVFITLFNSESLLCVKESHSSFQGPV